MTAPFDYTSLGVPLVPSKPDQSEASGAVSQRLRRRTDTFFDIYRHPVRFPNGRPFTGEREFRSGTEEMSESAGFITSDLQKGQFFCESEKGLQTPQERLDTLRSVWDCPWTPLAKYFRFNYRRRQITYALDKMISDEREGLNKYWLAAAKMAGESDGDFGPERPNKIPFRIRTLLGMPNQYTDQIKLAEAMKAGDPWLLGFVDTPNEALARILRIDVRYIGGHAADSEYVTVQLPPAPQPVSTPDAVLGMDATALAKLVADAVAAERQKWEAEEKAKRDRARENGRKGGKARAANASKPTSATPDAA